jgi:sigma-B regulation protein RsbU (phosphoserine phosphatase)
VQQRLYPAAPPAALGLDIGGNSFMAEETGGDYFDFVPLQDDALLLLVGDVSGHGFDAALVMAETRAYLRSIAQMKSDPGKILRSINRVLVGDIAENQFVTMLLACVDVRSRSLTYASAGHPSGYVLEPDGTVRNELVSTGPPLGIFQDAYFATQTMPVLRDGDVLALFSDGVSEPEASNGTPFGTARALEVVHAFRHEPSAKIVNRLYRAIRDYAPAQPLLDDITAVICKVGPTLT